jgi:hypothetical protein
MIMAWRGQLALIAKDRPTTPEHPSADRTPESTDPAGQMFMIRRGVEALLDPGLAAHHRPFAKDRDNADEIDPRPRGSLPRRAHATRSRQPCRLARDLWWVLGFAGGAWRQLSIRFAIRCRVAPHLRGGRRSRATPGRPGLLLGSMLHLEGLTDANIRTPALLPGQRSLHSRRFAGLERTARLRFGRRGCLA